MGATASKWGGGNAAPAGLAARRGRSISWRGSCAMPSNRSSAGRRSPDGGPLSRLWPLAWALSLFTLLWPTILYPLTLAVLSRLFGKKVRAQPGYEPTVTIVIPTYNEATLIRRRLEDVTRYDYDPDKIEVIVVDSGSSDGTAEIVKAVRGEGLLSRLTLVEEG